MMEAVKKPLKKGDSVSLVGFGTFSVSKRAARLGRNPRTGAALKIKAAKVPRFKAGKGLKDALNKYSIQIKYIKARIAGFYFSKVCL
jgi:DNA-binding protein HU-beta